MEPLVSVIVPVYNGEKYLADCLDSLINQLYKNVEIIIVNDGSTDGTKDILDFYVQKDNRIKVIHKENGGVSTARNTALEIAQGEYVHFCDADDWISIDFYKQVISLMENKKVDFAAVNTYMHDEENEPVIRMKMISEGKYNKIALLKYCCGVLGKRNNVATCFLAVNDKIFKRSVLYDKDGNLIQYKVGMKYLEDGKFLIDVLENVKSGYYFKKAFYHRRLNAESAMGKLDIIRLSQQMLDGYETLLECNFSQNNHNVKKYIFDAYERAAFYYVRQAWDLDCEEAVLKIRKRFSESEQFQKRCDDYYKLLCEEAEEFNG